MSQPDGRPPRLLSLDVFRGITIAAMLLVNEQGNSRVGFAALQHVPWHGATPTDWIFPFFLFIVGVALPYSIASRRRAGATDREILRHAITRGLILFALGVFEKNYPFLTATLDTFRIPGVLQRIAFCYVAAVGLELYATTRVKTIVAMVLLVGYWVLLAFVPVPGAGVMPLTREAAATNWPAWVDQVTMGRHLGYGNHTWDANGLLSSLPAIVTVQFGMLAAGLLRSVAQPGAAIGRMLRIGLACVLAGWVWGGFQPVVGLGILGEPSVDAAWVFPINKMLWSSSYVLYTGGLALILLAVCMRLIDLRASGLPGWARPFIWLGSNAIFAYLASGLVAKTLHTITLTDGTSLWAWGYRNLAEPWIPIPPVASLLYSIAYLLPWFLICWWMYQRKMFIRL